MAVLPTVLIVEYDSQHSDCATALRTFSYPVKVARTEADALAQLNGIGANGEIGIALLNMGRQEVRAMETLCEIRQFHPELPVILISPEASPTTIVTAMKSGATDFLCEPVRGEDLDKAIATALGSRPAAQQPVRRRVTVGDGLIGTSPEIASIRADIGQIGSSEVPVLIQGETGSGKEVVAREVHANSRRAKNPFFKLNCAALPSELVESELFGYERGAFTGAFQRKPGIFEAAGGGTILLDEIGDMDVRLQAKLLHVLQDQEFQRIGGKEMIKVDVRVIAATHRDLEKFVEDGKFRQDLYYRLNVITIVVPPLRDRKEDIPRLTDFFLKKHLKPGNPMPAITGELRSAMLEWSWPGNVRELENFVRKMLVFQDPVPLTRDLTARISRSQTAVAPVAATAIQAAERAGALETTNGERVPVLEQVNRANRRAEADAILAALDGTHWNRKQAAALLNVDYKALLYKMKKLGIDEEPPPVKSATATAASETEWMP